MKKILLFLMFLASPIFAQESEDPLKQFPEHFAEELNKSDQVGDSRFFDEFVQMMIYLSGIIAFMVFFLWVLKKMMSVKIEQSNRSSSIQIVDSRTLSQKTTLYVIEINGQNYTIAESINGVTRIGASTMKDNAETASFDEYMTP